MTITSSSKASAAFAAGDFVVYPAHGVGKVTQVEVQTLGEHKVELFVISFDQDRMTLRVPFGKVKTSGLRKLSTRRVMQAALTALSGGAGSGVAKRQLWNRRALEYSAKINSGDPVSIAQVVRDLHRSPGQPEQSHGARLLYEQARGRLALEIAAVEQIQLEDATTKVDQLLNAA